jgi:predicted nucleic acid-binding protein
VNYLLDISVLVALLTKTHTHHAVCRAWLAGKTPVLCPLSELGFIRVSMSPAHNATMKEARKALDDFYADEFAEFLAADISALEGQPSPSAGKSTDWYLANLAKKHGMKWATLDKAADHPARELVA